MMTADDFLNGQILLIDKPLHWTSFQAVNKIKWAIIKNLKLKKIKIGHAGTLDPLATGLLVICTGKFTKNISELQAETKTYTGTLRLGSTTPSYDLETEIDQIFPTGHITSQLIDEKRQQFLGEITQYPPVFSAVKKDGKRLYEMARNGEEVSEIPLRTVEIEKFDLQEADFPDLHFEVVCSKGTYIRSLAHDFGKSLGSGAHLTALRRTQSGQFSANNALTPDEFIEKNIPQRNKNYEKSMV
ncbi:MAG: tRNA pseudouridine(55) synthase TruB [Capnocytophaga sp.]|nr:tRNA pseudouridine(55) synthase TruB [Capnocytophaga sp.]